MKEDFSIFNLLDAKNVCTSYDLLHKLDILRIILVDVIRISKLGIIVLIYALKVD
jgi:hypothetical protein